MAESSVSAAETEARSATPVGRLRIHQAGKGPLGLLLPIWRKRDLSHAEFHARKFAEGQLETVKEAKEGKAGSQRLGKTHGFTPMREDITCETELLPPPGGLRQTRARTHVTRVEEIPPAATPSRCGRGF